MKEIIDTGPAAYRQPKVMAPEARGNRWFYTDKPTGNLGEEPLYLFVKTLSIRYEDAIVNNLAMVLRRFIYQANKESGDTSLKVLAGKAQALIEQYGLQGNPLRKDTILKRTYDLEPFRELAERWANDGESKFAAELRQLIQTIVSQ